ncbi:methylenetetrahydrofolate reductase (NAD(P)H) MET12 [Sugiyamaella lignohabitans]|uniref:Methylenetetrahydrofolate reductase (NAD(P)H) MET12 n=1 Tax=Sugiyamaella lignohabitans TaxID=796027 RepID=A0A167D496_9ASCO|nr:methylenetetrahydrofolate reductase (NAD(P)H) MET12 [Sugiyamaella lignohabitans]ANB12460.1 methylenetetrahydrofolate reductase (NAD(P)H) MET12 [Sugiyamaella lignohabitans]
MQNLSLRLQRMSKLGNLFVTVTWGAGGSSAQKSLELAGLCQQELGIPTCIHLTCTNMDRTILDGALERAKEMGIRNILALRGDPPRGKEYSSIDHEKEGGEDDEVEFKYAIDLVKYIRAKYGDYFCIGVAAYPEGHVDGVDSSDQNPDKDIPFLVEKVKAGADFIITQLFYDTQKFLLFEQKLRDHPSHVFDNIPLIPGLMPINTYSSFVRAAKLSHASIPPQLTARLDEIPVGDDEQVKQFGVDVVTDIIQNLIIGSHGRIRGFHFYTLNLEKSVALILEKSGLLQVDDEDESGHTTGSTVDSNDAVRRGSAIVEDEELTVANLHPGHKSVSRRRSSLLTHNRLITADSDAISGPLKAGKSSESLKDDSISEKEAGIKSSQSSTTNDVLAISSGEGDLGREATWDDFPNGRFGDSRSPAYGEIDGYGPTLHVDPTKALKLWGYPVDISDINNLFARHIRNELDILPFSDQTLSAETALIQEELLQLINKGYLTVASQPAGNAIKSTDRIFGWGPPGGRVFQKAFVEFFVSDEEWQKLKPKLDSLGDGTLSYYEGTYEHDKIQHTNLTPGSSNAVTWGVFPNREILQSTIIEEESFLAWREEAFSIWEEWRNLYKPKTASYDLLDHIYKTYHLVSVVHHDYFDESALWNVF